MISIKHELNRIITPINNFQLFTVLMALLSFQISAQNNNFTVNKKINSLLDNYCMECHDSDSMKGKVQLDNLSEVPLKSRLETFNKVKEQLFSYNMPPKKKDQPTEDERIALLKWVTAELDAHKASTLNSKLGLYRYGNLVPHGKLFSGEIKDTPYTESRYWRINEFIYNERVRQVFGKPGHAIKAKRHMANSAAQGRELDDKIIIGLPIVFNLPQESGVTYFDKETIGGSNFMALKKNAQWIVDVQTREVLKKMGVFKYPDKYVNTRGRYAKQMFPQFIFRIATPPVLAKILESKNPTEADFSEAINFQFQSALQRPASSEELKRYLAFTKLNMKTAGHIEALKKTLVAILMEPEFFYRSELGKNGKLTPREAAYAISLALTDCMPDQTLFTAAANGKLASKADYEREVRRILEDDNIAKPRILRFFRDYFGYIKTRKIFKEDQRYEGFYNPNKGVSYKFTWNVPGKIIDDADRFVEHILKEDKDVLKNLLTSDKFFVDYKGPRSLEDMQKYDEKQRTIYKFLLEQRKGKKSFSRGESRKLKGEVGKKFNESYNRNVDVNVKMEVFKVRYGEDGNKKNSQPITGGDPYIQLYNFDYVTWTYKPEQPFKVPNRMGILTHPAWLIAHAHNCHTDPIIRGKWIQEKLLGGYIPEVPIEADAQLDPDHNKTIRERLVKTEAKDCWGCHQKMNTLGNPFEIYDDFGRFRTRESLEHEDNIVGTTKVIRKMQFGEKLFNKKIYKTKPIDASGYLEGTGDKSLDGKVKDAHELIAKLAKSERVRQVFIRNVFRYFMGRNEMLSDSKTLIAADKAYVKSGGSFKELLVSILTSDSFINRKDSALNLSKR